MHSDTGTLAAPEIALESSAVFSRFTDDRGVSWQVWESAEVPPVPFATAAAVPRRPDLLFRSDAGECRRLRAAPLGWGDEPAPGLRTLWRSSQAVEIAPVDVYHVVAFPRLEDATAWADALRQRLDTPAHAHRLACEPRAVVWIDDRCEGGGAARGRAFASDGAIHAAMATGLLDAAEATALVPLFLMPDGLSLVIGDALDLAEHTLSRRARAA